MRYKQLSGNTLQFLESTFFYNPQIEDLLLDTAHKSKLSRSRLCLHSSPSSPTQEMIICLLHSAQLPTHSHPIDRHESYHVLRGCLRVVTFDSLGCISSRYSLKRGDLYWQQGGTIHHTSALTDFCIYHEILYGAYLPQSNLERYDFTP